MRLAVFTSKYPARVSTFFERDMRALIEAGVEVDIFPIYPLDSDMWQYSLDILDEQVLPRDRIHHLSGLQSVKSLRPYPVNKLLRFAGDSLTTSIAAGQYGPVTLAKNSYVLSKAWAWAREFGDRYDHVLAYWGNYAATCAYAFHRLLERPIPFSMWLHAGADLYDTPIYLREKMLYADQIVTCIAFNRKYLREHYADIYPEIENKLKVVYHGLDFADFPYQPGDRHPNRIIAVGRLSAEKGFGYLLRAARAVIDRGKEVEIEFVGDGEEVGQLKALAAELQIADRVHFSGWLKFAGVQAAMRRAFMLVHPSDGLGDGLPNVIREAMAVGTPVIASDIAGIHEALDDGKCGLLVPPRDVNALANAIEKLLGDASLRRVFADRARSRAEEKFDMWRNGRDLAAILETTKRPISHARLKCHSGLKPQDRGEALAPTLTVQAKQRAQATLADPEIM